LFSFCYFVFLLQDAQSSCWNKELPCCAAMERRSVRELVFCFVFVLTTDEKKTWYYVVEMFVDQFCDHIKHDDDEEEGRWKSGSRFINIRCLRFCWWFPTMIFWHKDTTLCL
jgi:hypothetical protein